MLTKDRYLSLIKSIDFGKKLPDAIYLHEEYLKFLPLELQNFIDGLSNTLELEPYDWNLIKLFRKSFKVSFLSYPDFYKDSYPALTKSVSVDLEKLSHKVIKYDQNENPPILHRKELFIPSSSPYQKEFQEITQEGEEIGLYEKTSKIGFKQGWLKLINEKGYQLVNGNLHPLSNFDEFQTTNLTSKIDRHKTAITRYDFSLPIKQLLQHEILTPDKSFFDYGCGKGSDLKALNTNGFKAKGWDPAFFPKHSKETAEVVNLGFVINVIEDFHERVDALLSAWDLTKNVLAVSAMLSNPKHTNQFEPYKDGVITSRNTFQKYYSQSELRDFLEKYLLTEAHTVAPGVFFIFKSFEDSERFAQAQTKRKFNWQKLVLPKPTEKDKAALLINQNSEVFEKFWESCLELGRLPKNHDEFIELNTLKLIVGTPSKALSVLAINSDLKDFETAFEKRREDLIYYFSMSLFQKRTERKITSSRLKNDVTYFFKNKTLAENEAKELLYSLAETEIIQTGVNEIIALNIPHYYEDNHSIVFHKSFLDQLPTSIRVYIGCATQLYGGLDNIDLIKVHISSGKVSFMGYDNFDSDVLPVLRERIKVNLWNQTIQFFDYVNKDKQPVLLNASTFMDTKSLSFKKQCAFDKRLTSALPQIDFKKSIHRNHLEYLLNEQSLTLKGSKFYKLK